ncbi:MAG: hypothetical protein AVDCRST_MAG27-702 [uncultured Craurococcus sp.]|uniref:NmrA-like domain-containing protein n=1 Tax=uncultured Craurococcus sp. TaxID=1135998 RepID=A0A6J4HPT2_9PROT|nr:MAG: hypothetical protein AVDCRST_MAG27-702 [uncultured Craurococcus sp.]
MTQTVLLAGATGMLGGRIARRLLDRPDARVRLLVRGGDSGKRAALDPLLARGAEIIEGDLADRASLDRATLGVAVIFSAVQGRPDVIVDGQVALAEIGRRNGVRRILPSDFALDLFEATPGEHAMFDLRRAADEKIAATGIEHVHVLQGALMEMFGPGMGTFDHEAGTVAFWGDGTRPIEVTGVEDTARMAARVALDRTVRNGKFAVAGDRISILGAADVVEARTGRRFERRPLGSEADLRAAIAEAREDASDPFKAVMLAYRLYMLTGQTALSGLQDDRYPDLELENFAAFAARALPRRAAA